MNCKECQKLLITDYLDNELPEEENRLVEVHLSECRECGRFYEDALAESKVFKEAGEVRPSEAVFLRIQALIRTSRPQNRKPVKSLLEEASGRVIDFIARIPYAWPRPLLGAALSILIAAAALMSISPYSLFQERQEARHYLEEQLLYFSGAEPLEEVQDPENEPIGSSLEWFL